MQDIWFSILESLDGKDPRVLPYLPFLLQDLWELGSSPGVISGLVKRHAQGQDRRLRVLDLGCGKGTVSVQLACDLECEVACVTWAMNKPWIRQVKKRATGRSM
jgi:SAM-dependent methyltransferase